MKSEDQEKYGSAEICLHFRSAAYDNAESGKTKLCCMHILKPLLVTSDKESRIQVWDYGQKRTILNTTLSLLMTDDNHIHTKKLKPEGRISKRMNEKYLGVGSIQKIVNDVETIDSRRHKYSISQVDFADVQTILSALTNNDIHISITTESRCEHAIIVVSDIGIVVFEYFKLQKKIITTHQLTKPPTCASVIHPDIILVGCGDGHIRVWNFNLGSSISTTQAHKGEINSMKILPSKSFNGDLDNFSTTMLSIGSDGSLLIWNVGLANGVFDEAVFHPFLKLDETILGISSDHIVYNKATDVLAVYIPDGKVKFWDLSEASPPALSKVQSKNTKRSSLLNFSLLGLQAQDVPAIKPSQVCKFDKSVSSAHSKVSSLCSWRNQKGSLIVCSKSNSFAIIDSQPSTTGAKGAQLNNFQLVRDVRVADILAKAASEAKILSRDELSEFDLKVYSVHSQSKFPSIIVLATSIGLIVLDMHYPPAKQNNAIVATSVKV